ncbi:MAG: LysM peptidoglycan-binding domain-containing protein, partial [Caldilineae bacterium]
HPAAPVLAHDEVVHVVRPGETLSQIAEQYGTTVEVLRALNQLGDVDFIWHGQRLIISQDPEPEQVAMRRPLAAQATIFYAVQPGDTLLGIANAYGIGLAHLVELNNISPSRPLLVGQILRVPNREGSPDGPPVDVSNLPIHVVQPGEHLGSIAAQYNTTPSLLAQVNQIENPSLIVPGQRLRIARPDTAPQRAPIGPDGYHVHTEFPTTTEKWIDVDLSEQRVVAYEGTEPVRAFIVSTGLPGTPTVTGTFRIWAKVPIQDMYGGNRAAGDYYYLKDVQWVQYFYEDYSFHGTYWHNNFGRPMSRGCVNMRNEDAEWLYRWAAPENEGGGWLFSDASDPGTLVVVHP